MVHLRGFCALLLPLALAACQPGRPLTGPGSAENYIASSVAEMQQGSVTADGSTLVYWYAPDVLKDGATAPVVVYLHGFQATNPALYRAHIDHIALQGNLVVFPVYNAGNPLNDLDQNVAVDRIVANASAALAALGAAADLSRLYVFGHSAGAAFGSVWEHNGGAPARASVLAHPSIDPNQIPVPIEITPVDWAAEAPSTTGDVAILTGDRDTIAFPSESLELYGYLTGAASRRVWEARYDGTQFPPIAADHLGPLSTPVDTLDWRFYWAALDQAMAGDATPTFDFGAWAGGAPVLPPLLLAP